MKKTQSHTYFLIIARTSELASLKPFRTTFSNSSTCLRSKIDEKKMLYVALCAYMIMFSNLERFSSTKQERKNILFMLSILTILDNAVPNIPKVAPHNLRND